MIFDARQIARGWLAVALASATDKYRPALHRTIHIGEHAHGLRLVATDSYTILHAFVPELDHENDQAPELDEPPTASATAVDIHNRAKGFLAHVLRLATAGDADPIDVRVRLNVLDPDHGPQTTFAGMEARTVIVEQPDVERIVLSTYDGSFPEGWRDMLAAVDPVETNRLALDPARIANLAKVAAIHPSARLGWTFGGENKAIRVEVLDSDPFIDGLVMPTYWDFSTNTPRVDNPTPPDDEADQ